MNELEIKQLVEGMIRQDREEGAYGLQLIQYHAHTGVDSPQIQAMNISGLFTKVYESQNQLSAANYAVSHTLLVNDNVSGVFRVVGASAVFSTASTSGTLQVEVATGTQAVAAGTNQLTATMSLAGTANTTVNGTVTAPTNITSGSRVNLIFAGNVTNLANCSITVLLQQFT